VETEGIACNANGFPRLGLSLHLLADAGRSSWLLRAL